LPVMKSALSIDLTFHVFTFSRGRQGACRHWNDDSSCTFSTESDWTSRPSPNMVATRSTAATEKQARDGPGLSELIGISMPLLAVVFWVMVGADHAGYISVRCALASSHMHWNMHHIWMQPQHCKPCSKLTGGQVCTHDCLTFRVGVTEPADNHWSCAPSLVCVHHELLKGRKEHTSA
jgi:hypothetical protein